MNIVRAMDDPALFASHFKGDTWGAWRAFLAALFALPMDEAELATYRHHTGRTEPPTQPFKEAALICGRRAGKSRIMALLAVYLACFRDYAPHLAPGEVATIAIIAADRRQARIILRYITGALRSIDMLAELIEDEGAESVTLTNRVVIEVATASFRVTRGYSFAACLCDETAFWRSDNTMNPDAEIIAALRPGMSTIPGAMLLMASSPYAKRGVLFDSFRWHFGKDGARVLVWKASTQEMNPSIDPAVVAEAYEVHPAAAAAEYGGEFRTDIASFVAREVVDAAVVPGRYELPSGPVRHVAFTDPSGGSADSFTLAIAHKEGSGESEVAVLDLVREVKPPFSPDAVVAEFAADLRRYGLREVTGDFYGGLWPSERFKAHGITYRRSERSKSDIYKEMLPRLNAGRIELLDNPRLVAQLVGLERRVGRGGRDSIDHGPGSSDDVINAAAGALLASSGVSSTLDRWRALGGGDTRPVRENMFASERDRPNAFQKAGVFPRVRGHG